MSKKSASLTSSAEIGLMISGIEIYKIYTCKAYKEFKCKFTKFWFPYNQLILLKVFISKKLKSNNIVNSESKNKPDFFLSIEFIWGIRYAGKILFNQFYLYFIFLLYLLWCFMLDFRTKYV